MLVWQAQAQSDLLRVVGRLQSVLNYQLALALQKTLGDFLQPTEQLSALLLIAVCERALDSVCMGSEIVRGVLVVQVGQAIQNLLPSTAWTTASETPTRTLLTRVHFGVPPAYICLLAFLLSHRVLSDSQASGVLTLFQYVGRALHMLFVDWFLGSVVASTHELSQLLQMSMLTMLVVIVDELQLDRLSLMRDVRGYLLYRIAGELQELGVLSMDGSSALSAALLAIISLAGLTQIV